MQTDCRISLTAFVRRTGFILFNALLLWFGFFGWANADNGPHGGYTATTDACAGCHRAHTAAASKLLFDAVPNLCFTCHGTTTGGAQTDVVDGIYALNSRGLKGGGFVNAVMDTNWDDLAITASVTSNHLNNGSSATAWGNGAIGSGVGATIQLSCVSCHNPHGRAGTGNIATYRILRARPTNSGASSDVNVSEEVTKNYTVTNANNKYFAEDYASRTAELSTWCAQCHTRYMASSGSGGANSGDADFAYRHTTQAGNCMVCHPGFSVPPSHYGISHTIKRNPGCLVCHVAHGTTAMMGIYSGNVPFPGGATTPNGNARSSLLRLDNRGVCELCHGK